MAHGQRFQSHRSSNYSPISGHYAAKDASAESIRAYLDLNRLISRHSAVVGSTGSGKSNAVANILGAISDQKHFQSARVVLFDLHGEYPFDDGNIDHLLRNADSAMYAAKTAGRNCYRFYAEDMTVRAMEQLALQAGLRHALEKGEFILHYQPQLDLGSNRIIGVEALVRWQHPEKGMISPAQFIPAAEDSGLIVPLGEWVLRTACLQAKAWHEQGLDVRMAVNLSARQFREPLFSDRVMEILNETGLDPRQLELEITESILVEGLESVSAVLREFKQTGIMISLDDFGTGYSSLSYLKRFPIDKLKIDQSFVRDLLTDASDANLVKAIIAMSRALGLTVIAEGVETQAHVDSLRAEGCDEIQGYHIARPMPAEKAADLILRYNSV